MAMLRASYDSVLCADTLEIRNSRIAVGCYELEKQDGSSGTGGIGPERRKGCVWILDKQDLKPLSVWNHESSGVLDLRWSGKAEDMLILACADGSVRVLRHSESTLEVKHTLHLESSLTLSVDVNEEAADVVLSFSTGSVRALDLNMLKPKWQAEDAHGYEAWVVTCDSRHASIAFSGGDDGSLKLWDMRCSADLGPVAVNSRAHQASGVISIQPDPLHDNGILTGGYDDHIRFFDMRSLKRSAEPPVQLEGGPWRIKIHPDDPRYILVPAMYAGAYLLRRDDARNGANQICHYGGHQSIAYGACWMDSTVDPLSVATCSFYDHAVHVWSAKNRASLDEGSP
uniref:methylated diphthine methylhydrolase n=1 Tax=Rhodosorus marinus TaxID=101924 RepID=A0A7S3A148_9RHOD|mmetsp:Transcript_40777/g.161578  ORF Transcript_40777/g.161578 Transcript_40777/m.161578 type:complete len:342 (+) Transcript_40777:209-1234(+)